MEPVHSPAPTGARVALNDPDVLVECGVNAGLGSKTDVAHFVASSRGLSDLAHAVVDAWGAGVDRTPIICVDDKYEFRGAPSFEALADGLDQTDAELRFGLVEAVTRLLLPRGGGKGGLLPRRGLLLLPTGDVYGGRVVTDLPATSHRSRRDLRSARGASRRRRNRSGSARGCRSG